MKVRVDPTLCTGCGPCVDICPEVFEIDQDSVAIVKVNQIPADLEKACREAADNCPTEAIEIEE